MASNIGNTLRMQPGPVLVTGHTGFKGTWLTLLLESLNIDVVGYSLRPTEDSLFRMLKREGKIEEKFADITHFFELQQFIHQTKPCAIVHLAAQPLVLESYREPVATFNTNVMGTVNLLEAAFSEKSVKVIGAITTDKVYQNLNKGNRFVENDPLKGKDPYSASKVGSEAAISAWQQIQKLNGGPKVLSLRAGNVIGGGDQAQDRLIPDLIRAFQGGNEVKIRSPKSTRPWQHVLDPLIGYITAIEKAFSNIEYDAFNFGPKEASLRVIDLIRIFEKTIGSQVNISIEEQSSDFESITLDLDSTRAIQNLNWSPVCDQTEAIMMTFDWWESVIINGEDPEKVTKLNITDLLSRIS